MTNPDDDGKEKGGMDGLVQRIHEVLSSAANSTPPRKGATTSQVAHWMKEQVENSNYALSQKTALHGIRSEFGDDHVILKGGKRRSYLGIAPEVLKEFARLTPDVVWSRRDQVWRKRLPTDPPKGRQVK